MGGDEIAMSSMNVKCPYCKRTLVNRMVDRCLYCERVLPEEFVPVRRRQASPAAGGLARIGRETPGPPEEGRRGVGRQDERPLDAQRRLSGYEVGRGSAGPSLGCASVSDSSRMLKGETMIKGMQCLTVVMLCCAFGKASAKGTAEGQAAQKVWIRGHIRTADGAPVSGVEVRCFEIDPKYSYEFVWQQGTEVSDDQGQYAFSMWGDREYRITAGGVKSTFGRSERFVRPCKRGRFRGGYRCCPCYGFVERASSECRRQLRERLAL